LLLEPFAEWIRTEGDLSGSEVWCGNEERFVRRTRSTEEGEVVIIRRHGAEIVVALADVDGVWSERSLGERNDKSKTLLGN
jgi:hypothetical protein